MVCTYIVYDDILYYAASAAFIWPKQHICMVS